MASLNPSPGEGLMLPNLNIYQLSLSTRFLIISLPSNAMSSISPFVIQKALIGIGVEPESVKRLRSGDLLIETLSAIQTKSFLQANTFLNSPVKIYSHKTLNSCRGIISESDLLTTTDAEILDGFSGQGVIQPATLTAEFARTFRILCAISSARGSDIRKYPAAVNRHALDVQARKLIVPQLSQTCAQAAKSSTLNNSTQTDENITKIKCPPLKLLAPLSSKQRTNIPTAVTTSSSAQTQICLPSRQKHLQHRILSHQLSCLKQKGKLKNNHLNYIIAREQDSPNETSPVSEKSLRRKTFNTSDAMDTDANPFDWDYVIDDIKYIIRQYHPVCVAFQETFLKSCHTTKIRRYGCVRKDTEGHSVSGDVCIFTSLDVPSSALPLHTSLQAVAVRIHFTSLITVCCLYLSPNTVIHQHDLNNLVDELPAPFVILGDFNGHITLWGSAKTNPRGRQIEQVLSDHCLCLLNHEEPTYFHEPTRFFHTLDLAICSPSLFPNLNLPVEMDLYNSDHFPVILSHDHDTGGKTFPPTYPYSCADRALFTQLAVIPDAMVKTESIDTAVQEITNVLIAAADLSLPNVSSHSFQRYKPWWNTDCQTAYKNQRKLWGIFRRYPTTENLLAFKKAKANARRVRRRSQRQSWIRYVSSLTSSTSSKQLWKKVKAANGIYREFSFPILQTSDSVFSSPDEIANILAVRYFYVRIGHSSSHKFMQDHDVPQGSVLSVTLFYIHMSNILHQLPPSVRGMLYVDDLQVSCQGSDMRLGGCGSPVVKVSNHGRHVMSSIPVPLKTRRVGQRCTLNLSRAETSSRWCGVVVRRGGCQLRCRPRHLTMVQNYVVRRQKPSCS
ncbi:RNA-directed DNA polymerase from mobile element jockey [Trichonephila clavipes]|nr:RNA-directed DNA polymerase from mobile element jockey [Trichonephila clavipes]